MTVSNLNPIASTRRWLLSGADIMRKRLLQTPRLPDLVGAVEACEILGIQKMTLSRWLKPGSGTADWSHGPDRTYMIEPKRIRSGPVWTREDVEWFAQAIGRQRAPAQPAASKS